MNGFDKPKVLVVCQTNRCLSQMAAGFLNAFAGDLLDVHCAGLKPASSIHAATFQVMAEAGIDIRRHKLRHMNEFLPLELDAILFLSRLPAEGSLELPRCDNRHEWVFDDPCEIAATEDQRIPIVRKVRDEIRRVCEAYANGRADAETRSLMRWPSPFTPV